eukprot:846579-Prymnesium_polylepis.1
MVLSRAQHHDSDGPRRLGLVLNITTAMVLVVSASCSAPAAPWPFRPILAPPRPFHQRSLSGAHRPPCQCRCVGVPAAAAPAPLSDPHAPLATVD